MPFTSSGRVPRPLQHLLTAVCALALALTLSACASKGPQAAAAALPAADPPGCDVAALEATKAARRIAPLEAPALYVSVVYGDKQHVGDELTASGLTLRVAGQYDDASGLSATTLKQSQGDHAVLVLQGMSRFGTERGGLGDFMTDLGASLGSASAQWAPAQRIYRQLICDASVQSVEVIGFSLGSQAANWLAVRDHAVATTFGDMGVPKAAFAGLDASTTQNARARLKTQVTSLKLSGDVLVRMFAAGDVGGTVIELPAGLSGIGHQPEIYQRAADDLRGAGKPEPAGPTHYPAPAWR